MKLENSTMITIMESTTMTTTTTTITTGTTMTGTTISHAMTTTTEPTTVAQLLLVWPLACSFLLSCSHASPVSVSCASSAASARLRRQKGEQRLSLRLLLLN